MRLGTEDLLDMEIAAAGGIVFDERHRVLLIRRGRPPGAGSWSVPGGKSLPDESAADTCVRELAEETGLIVEVIRHVGRVCRPTGDGSQFIIDDFSCRITGGRLLVGDDASAAGWFDRTDLSRLPLVDGLLAALEDWGLQPD